MLTTPGGRSNFLHDLGKFESSEWGVACWFEHDGIAHRQRGGDFPGQHEQWKVPGDDLPNDTYRLVAGEFRGHELRPTGMVVEVTGDERDIDISRLTDGLAVIQRFQHGQQTRVFLDVTCDGIHVASAYMSWRLAPCFKGLSCGGYGGIDVGTAGGSNLRQRLTGRRG